MGILTSPKLMLPFQIARMLKRIRASGSKCAALSFLLVFVIVWNREEHGNNRRVKLIGSQPMLRRDSIRETSNAQRPSRRMQPRLFFIESWTLTVFFGR